MNIKKTGALLLILSIMICFVGVTPAMAATSKKTVTEDQDIRIYSFDKGKYYSVVETLYINDPVNRVYDAWLFDKNGKLLLSGARYAFYEYLGNDTVLAYGYDKQGSYIYDDDYYVTGYAFENVYKINLKTGKQEAYTHKNISKAGHPITLNLNKMTEKKSFKYVKTMEVGYKKIVPVVAENMAVSIKDWSTSEGASLIVSPIRDEQRVLYNSFFSQNESFNQDFAFEKVGKNKYRIFSLSSSLQLKSTENGNLVLGKRTDTDSQVFTVLVNSKDETVNIIDYKGRYLTCSKTAEGSLFSFTKANKKASQKFMLIDHDSKANGCISADGNSEMYYNRDFTPTDEEGFKAITPFTNAGTSINVYGSSTEVGAKVALYKKTSPSPYDYVTSGYWTWRSYGNQQFALEKVGKNKYRIWARHTNQQLTYRTVDKECKLVLGFGSERKDQVFTITNNNDGSVYIQNNKGKYLTMKGGTDTSGTELIFTDFMDGDTSQKFVIG